MKCLYHATNINNLNSIISNGLKTGNDGYIYLAETKEDAIKFMALQLIGQPIIVLEIKISKDDEKFLTESFDHNEKFFKCKAWRISKNIDFKKILNCWKYE